MLGGGCTVYAWSWWEEEEGRREVSAFWLLQSDTITNYSPQVFVPSSSLSFLSYGTNAFNYLNTIIVLTYNYQNTFKLYYVLQKPW